MTKEEYYKAKEILRMANDYPTSEYNDSRLINNSINLFENLIHEHFDNPPLSFEELEAEMWVWDNKEKMYIKSCNNFDTEEYGKGIRIQMGFDLVRYPYEENRYYRKEVK